MTGSLDDADTLAQIHVAVNEDQILVLLQIGDHRRVMIAANRLAVARVEQVVIIIKLGNRARVRKQLRISRMVVMQMGIEHEVNIGGLQANLGQRVHQILFTGIGGAAAPCAAIDQEALIDAVVDEDVFSPSCSKKAR